MDIALTAARLISIRVPVPAAAAAVARLLRQERDRWVLWLPVALGAGIGLYFELAAEPETEVALAVAAAGLALALLGACASRWLPLGAACFATALGFAAAKLHADWARAPILTERAGPLMMRGRIIEAEPTHKGLRIVVKLDGLDGGVRERPERVRLTVANIETGFAAGERIAVRAVLLPPPAPAAPGAYDFQRHAYFQKIGAVGYAVNMPAKVGVAHAFEPLAALERLRQSITERIVAALPSPTGALAAAQITGHRNAIPPEIMTAMQDSGLAHLLAISGMNIGIVAGIVFFAVRGLMALVPFLALRLATKKWAAVAALIVALAYVLISGASIPTQRAYFMLAAVMLGVLIDRETLSMRLVAWAAVVILLAAPHGLLGPSFQMSFAAVVALIACYERFALRRAAGDPPSPLMRWLRGIGLLALTSLVAGLATAPFGIYSFNRVTSFGLAANLIAVPVTDLWVMPWALVAMLAMPFGVDAGPLQAMGLGVDVITAVAREVAAWPGAVVPTTAMPSWGLLLFALGGLWLTIWQRRWRFAGLPVMAAGMLSMLSWQQPDLIVAGDGKSLAARAADGGLYVVSADSRSFGVETWQRRAASAAIKPWPRMGATPDRLLRCDALGCSYGPGDGAVTIVRDPLALVEDCGAARAIVAPGLTRVPCRNMVAVDRRALMSRGSHALWLKDTGVRIQTDRGVRGQRPWVSHPWREAETPPGRAGSD